MAAPELFAPEFSERPYWWEEAPPAPPERDALPDSVDVAVVGGGYCGISAELELARQGASVVVLEARRIGDAASSLNGGMVSGGLKLVGTDLARRFGSAPRGGAAG